LPTPRFDAGKRGWWDVGQLGWLKGGFHNHVLDRKALGLTSRSAARLASGCHVVSSGFQVAFRFPGQLRRFPAVSKFPPRLASRGVPSRLASKFASSCQIGWPPVGFQVAFHVRFQERPILGLQVGFQWCPVVSMMVSSGVRVGFQGRCAWPKACVVR
jgi:hypothetical protein